MGLGVTAILEATSVSVRYGGNVAVADVTISVAPGELVGLIGPNGAGKTTLFDAITGFVRPNSGVVRFDGREMGRRSPSRRARLGMRRTFQGAELFDDLTVRQNVAAAAPSADVAQRWLERLDLLGHAEHLALHVPTGVRRRVDLARALAAAPKVVLLDEPGAGLERDQKERLAALLRDIRRSDGIGFVLVDHDMDLIADVCERVYVLALGRVIASGTVAEVMRDSTVIDAYLGAP